jgi:signal transduction histidine kinase
VVRTAVTDSELHAGVTSALLTLALLGGGLLALSLVVADRLGRAVGRPITEVARAAHALHEGRLETRAPVEGPREVRELAAALNRLAERIVELLAAEREAVADLSHRLRTPLTALRLHADNEGVPSPERRGGASANPDRTDEPHQRLRDHVAALERTVDSILRDARRPVTAAVSRSSDARAVVGSRAAFWLPLAEDQGRKLSVDLPQDAVAVGVDAGDLADAVDALIDNVFAHTPEGASLRLAVRATRSGDVEISVEDAGPGVPAGVDERGSSQVGSSGLGLDIARRTAESAGGHLSVGRSQLGGAAVRLVLAAPADGEGGRVPPKP